MFRKKLLILALALFSISSFAQTGTLQGNITDAITGEPIPFANVVITKNGNQTGGTTTDFDGKYTIKPIDPGTYNIKATFVGFQTKEITGVIISADQIRYVDIKLQEGVQLDVAEVVVWTKPLLDQGNLSGETKTSEEIVALPTRSVSSVAATTAGIYQRDEGDGVNIRGSRQDATEYYIDGIKVRGTLGIPTSGIEQIKVVTGGIPAQYGDATGGIISLTTKGPSNRFSGGVELESSSLFDKYNYNLLGFSLTGPIIKKRNSDGTKGSAILGFFVSGEYRNVDDPDPSALGVWKVKDSKLAALKSTPFVIAPNSAAGFLSTSDFLSPSDLENVQAKLNTNDERITLQGKIDFKPTNNTYLTIGGNYITKKMRDYSYWRSLLSWENNREETEKTYRIYGKLTQKFGTDESNNESSSSTIKNAFFTIQANYTNNQYTFVDSDHQFNLFNYGYVGKFITDRTKIYSRGDLLDTNTGIWYNNVQIDQGFQDTLLSFTPSNINPGLVNYTSAYYDMFSNYGLASFVGSENDGVIRTIADLKGQGLINGEDPEPVYSLYGNHGTIYSSAAKLDRQQTTFKASGSADINSHEISFGFEYEQRVDAYFGVAARNLWTLSRQLMNTHILERDLANPNPKIDNLTGIFLDTINYNRLNAGWERDNLQFLDDNFTPNPTFGDTISTGAQSNFDYQFRLANGLNPRGRTFVDVDSYDPSNFDISYFSPDELLNNGSSLVYYYGYDIYGNKLDNNNLPTLFDFFDSQPTSINRKVDGNQARQIAPFSPIYTAGYIQDKFAIEDLIFNIGLRVDRYDANQKVLKDRYSLYNIVTKGQNNVEGDLWNEIATSNGNGVHPTTIGDNFAVYVDDLNDPTKVVGYRNGDTWYNAEGLEISDPTTLTEAAGGKIAPLLGLTLADRANATNLQYTREEAAEAWKDYEPQVVFMPRIAFSFPISDEAQFFAHYDVLTQRPPSFNRLEPVDYLFMADRVGATLNNPDLKPEKTIDYEIGFAKTLSLSSALKISAFYKELRDMIQIVNTLGAYPAQYYTYGNIDFGTVKGLSVNYDLRRTNNVSLTANYTLQFADGTGSSATSGQSLVNTGQPNLRTTIPLSYDQRHALMASVDYRYGIGKKYNGPVWFGKKIFQDAGVNMIMTAGSGTPYSRQSNITQEAAAGINDRSTLEGSLNGSRLPWQFRLSAKINKNFVIKWNDKGKKSNLNFYVQVQNLLNAKNIISVYRATGNADDDGYLTDAASQNSINAKNNPDTFRYLYSLAVNDPSNYSLPRMWRAGISIDF